MTFLVFPGLVVLFFSPFLGVVLIVLGVGVPIALRQRVKGDRRWIAAADRIRI